MLMLASSGLYLAILKSQGGNIIGSIITFFLIATVWPVGRRSCTGRLDWAALVVGTGGAAAVITLGVQSLHTPDRNAPAGMAFFFGVLLLLAATGNIRMLIGGGISRRQRITRHLWHMCFGLFIATGSFFLGQQPVFPAFLRGSVLLMVLATGMPTGSLPKVCKWLCGSRSFTNSRVAPWPFTTSFNVAPQPAL
jgi:hypothetical protein